MGGVEMVKITKASETDAQLISQLADEIWREHYDGILKQEVIDYVLGNFQTEQNIADQISRQELTYFLMHLNDEVVGYSGIEIKDDELFLSKLYLKQKFRGLGIAKETLSFIEENYLNDKKKSISLYVSNNNEKSIEAYKKMGFEIQEEVERDLGQGFVGYDYFMKKEVGKNSIDK